MSITEERLAEIRARLAAATPAPWEVGDGWVYTAPCPKCGGDRLRSDDFAGSGRCHTPRAER